MDPKGGDVIHAGPPLISRYFHTGSEWENKTASTPALLAATAGACCYPPAGGFCGSGEPTPNPAELGDTSGEPVSQWCLGFLWSFLAQVEALSSISISSFSSPFHCRPSGLAILGRLRVSSQLLHMVVMILVP